MPTDEDVVNQQQVLVATMSYTMNAKSYSGTELQSRTKLQKEDEEHFDSKISVHERNVELPDSKVHSDSEVDKPNEENKAEPNCQIMSRDIALLNKLLEINMLDQ